MKQGPGRKDPAKKGWTSVTNKGKRPPKGGRDEKWQTVWQGGIEVTIFTKRWGSKQLKTTTKSRVKSVGQPGTEKAGFLRREGSQGLGSYEPNQEGCQKTDALEMKRVKRGGTPGTL